MNVASELLPRYLRRRIEAVAVPETMGRLISLAAAALHGVRPVPGLLVFFGTGADLIVAGLLAYWQHCGFNASLCPWSWVSAKSETPPPADSDLPRVLGLTLPPCTAGDLRTGKLRALSRRTSVIVGPGLGVGAPGWPDTSVNDVGQPVAVFGDLANLNALDWPSWVWDD